MVRLIDVIGLPMAVLAATIPTDGNALGARQSEDCQIDRANGGLWVENGMTRNKVIFSSHNTPSSAYCDIWRNHVQYPDAANNLQCWTNEDNTAGELDVSFARGPAGDWLFNGAFEDTLSTWRQNTHCKTG